MGDSESTVVESLSKSPPMSHSHGDHLHLPGTGLSQCASTSIIPSPVDERLMDVSSRFCSQEDFPDSPSKVVDSQISNSEQFSNMGFDLCPLWSPLPPHNFTPKHEEPDLDSPSSDFGDATFTILPNTVAPGAPKKNRLKALARRGSQGRNAPYSPVLPCNLWEKKAKKGKLHAQSPLGSSFPASFSEGAASTGNVESQSSQFMSQSDLGTFIIPYDPLESVGGYFKDFAASQQGDDHVSVHLERMYREYLPSRPVTRSMSRVQKVNVSLENFANSTGIILPWPEADFAVGDLVSEYIDPKYGLRMAEYLSGCVCCLPDGEANLPDLSEESDSDYVTDTEPMAMEQAMKEHLEDAMWNITDLTELNLCHLAEEFYREELMKAGSDASNTNKEEQFSLDSGTKDQK